MSLDLATAGPLLYGKRWQAPLARDLSVSREALRLWQAGAHQMPDDKAARLRELLRARSDAIRAALR